MNAAQNTPRVQALTGSTHATAQHEMYGGAKNVMTKEKNKKNKIIKKK